MYAYTLIWTDQQKLQEKVLNELSLIVITIEMWISLPPYLSPLEVTSIRSEEKKSNSYGRPSIDHLFANNS